MTSSSPGSYVTINEYLQLAVEFEIDSAAFYRDLQKTVEDENALTLLKLLEQQEIAHERMLRGYEITDDPDYILQFPPSLQLSMPLQTSDNPGFDEMLALAIEREQRAAEIYEKTAALVSGAFRDLLEGLGHFEREHEERLKSLKSYY